MARTPAYCYCHTCKRSYDSLGIMNHRRRHRNRAEDCTITYKSRGTITHYYSESGDRTLDRLAEMTANLSTENEVSK